MRVPSPGSLTSPLPLGSVRTEIASAELDAIALLFVQERQLLECCAEMPSVRNATTFSTPFLIGGEDLKRIADQIVRSLLDPTGAEDDAVRIEAVGEDRDRAFANDSPAAYATNVPSRIAMTGPRASLSRTSTRHDRPGHTLALTPLQLDTESLRGRRIRASSNPRARFEQDSPRCLTSSRAQRWTMAAPRQPSLHEKTG